MAKHLSKLKRRIEEKAKRFRPVPKIEALAVDRINGVRINRVLWLVEWPVREGGSIEEFAWRVILHTSYRFKDDDIEHIAEMFVRSLDESVWEFNTMTPRQRMRFAARIKSSRDYKMLVNEEGNQL